MARPVAASAAVALALVLAGCATAPSTLRAMTPDEARAYLDEQDRRWWESMFPGDPMPEVEVVEYAQSYATNLGARDCLLAADLPGVTAVNGDGLEIGQMTAAETDVFNRVQWECAVAYPMDTSDPESLGLYSEEQLTYLSNYFSGQLTPCLRAMGYRVAVAGVVTRVEDNPYLQWSPYWAMSPQPDTAEEWARIDLRCPPPIVGDFYRPGVDY